MTVPRSTLCECGCGLTFEGRTAIWGRWIKGHEDAIAGLIVAGKIEAPFYIRCHHCGEIAPALARHQKFCTKRMTGRECQHDAKAAARELRRLANVGKPKATAGVIPRYDFPFNRRAECLTDGVSHHPSSLSVSVLSIPLSNSTTSFNNSGRPGIFFLPTITTPRLFSSGRLSAPPDFQRPDP